MTEVDSTHSAATRSSLDFAGRTVGAEIRYRTPKLSWLALQARRTDRNYPNREVFGFTTVDNGHREFRLNTVASWQYSGTTKIDARVGHVDLRHDQLAVRHFSGVTWQVGTQWDATPKLRLRLGLKTSKDIRLYEDITTSYIVEHSIGLDPI